MNAPLTHATEDRRGRICQCDDCGLTVECAPSRDFFTKSTELISGEVLRCWACFTAMLDRENGYQGAYVKVLK
jgi:hypothetical protein